MSKSALETLREDGFTFDFEHRLQVSTKGVWVFGCDCAEPMPDKMVPQVIEALLAYQRHRKNEAELT